MTSGDSRWPRAVQYVDSRNLSARCSLHARFSTNPTGWFLWVFEQIIRQEPGRVLEVGTGTAQLWVDNRQRIPDDWQVTLTDVSAGMVRDARERLPTSRGWFLSAADVERLPFPDQTFDTVVANHMLYHAPDPGAAVREIRRVLAPGGRLIAATNGRAHLRELFALISRHVDAEGKPQIHYRFSLETGEAVLREAFSDVQILRYPDGLVITDPQAVVDYASSIVDPGSAGTVELARLRETAADLIGRDGHIPVTKDTGLLIAQDVRPVDAPVGVEVVRDMSAGAGKTKDRGVAPGLTE